MQNGVWSVDHLVTAPRTVLAHGCFDLLHLGHIRHLQEARKLGDRLVVSVTDDPYVSKGIGRPHFNAEQRAAALRALSCVDEVIINPSRDAVPVISQVKPAIYVKGADYKEDAGAGLAIERMAVEAVGGKIVFTDSEKFSSSKILKAEMFSVEVCQYLEKAKAAGFKDKILSAFDQADVIKVSFVGEVIIDEYRYVKGLGKSSKEMMLATVEVGVEQFEGGSIAASKHAEWKTSEWMATSCQPIKKTRYVDSDFNRKLFDVYSARKIHFSDTARRHFRSHLCDVVKGSSVVVVMDFGHGLIGPEERGILNEADFLAVNAQSNAGNYGFNLVTKYERADYICVDDPEARLAAGMQEEPIDRVIRDGLSSRIACHKFLVTHGRFGSMWREDLRFGEAPAFSTGGIDTMGAGDAVMAVTAPLIATGLPLEIAAFVGNITGAIKTSIIGHRRHVNRQEIIQTVEALLA
jgi:rfaE bifunctional protein nucleotidyltransferase chain/domain